MRIVMFTNTYVPMVGGVALSVDRFTRGYRERGHRVLVVAPDYADRTEPETETLRIPSIEKFNNSDFSLAVPLGGDIERTIEAFRPQIIHSHHPYLLGSLALREAEAHELPIVFTHHTMYEHYTHYVPLPYKPVRNYLKKIATLYGNLCDRIIAPSESLAAELKRRGVKTPIRVAPTGVDIETYAKGDAAAFRRRFEIPDDAFLIGHVGRLAEEKNLLFLARSVAEAMRSIPEARFAVIGAGPAREEMEALFRDAEMADRVHFTGTQKNQNLVDAYHAMDLFAFASKTETQGMVLVEALAAGCPLVALDAPGAREVVRDGENGRLIGKEETARFAEAIVSIARMNPEEREQLIGQARDSAKPFAVGRCVETVLDLYEELLNIQRAEGTAPRKAGEWAAFFKRLAEEWELLQQQIRIAAESVIEAASEEQEDSETGQEMR